MRHFLMETSEELYGQLLAHFKLSFYRKYGLQLGVCLLVTLVVICASVKCLKNKKKSRKTRKDSSSYQDRDNAQREFDEEGFRTEINGDPNHHSISLNWEQLSENKMLQKSKDFYQFMNQRRTVRTFSKEKFPRKIIENIILTAGTSPSGANQQPWTYVVVDDHEMKSNIRQIVEAEEEINYKRRMGNQWVEALKHLNVNWIKPYITDAPYVILIFKQTYAKDDDGNKIYHYYSELSTAIATGILYAAIHNAGLVSLVSTPMNCDRALTQLLRRPSGEHLLFLMPIGYPTLDCTVPAIKRKNLENIYVHH